MPRLPIRPHIRSFLRARGPWALAFIVIVAGLTACKPAASGLDEGFLHPPDAAKPRVYWWWLFNRINKAAITRDLEEFKAKGISGVNLICTGGYAGLAPLPGVKFLGPEWRELFRHAVKEAARLKIEMGFNLAGGWVMIGPWVSPDNAMKKVVPSELKVRGPVKFRGTLPAPPAVDGYYKDVWVQAFPEEPRKAVNPRTIVDVNGRSLGVLWTAPWRVDITNAVRPWRSRAHSRSRILTCAAPPAMLCSVNSDGGGPCASENVSPA
jgi:hypothetical protein